MRKIVIVEIENSFLNFFTPAIIVAASYFLFNLIAWFLLLLNMFIEAADPRFFSFASIMNMLLIVIVNFFVCGIVYFVFIPKFKIREAEYTKVNAKSFFIVFLLAFLAIFSHVLITRLSDLFTTKSIHNLALPEEIDQPFIMMLYLLLLLISSALFSELIFRRTIIPLLEDRGLSPFLAVILSSLGSCFISLPTYILYPNIINMVFDLSLIAIYGMYAGITYILTRNIIFPFLLGAFYSFYEVLSIMGSFYDNGIFLFLYDLIYFISLLVTLFFIIYLVWIVRSKIVTPEWVEKIKERSATKIQRGIIGFFVISIGLLVFQAVVVRITRELTNSWNNPSNIIPGYAVIITIFYIIASVIPFFLTISTEYARD